MKESIKSLGLVLISAFLGCCTGYSLINLCFPTDIKKELIYNDSAIKSINQPNITSNEFRTTIFPEGWFNPSTSKEYPDTFYRYWDTSINVVYIYAK